MALFPRLQEIEDLNVMHKFDRRLERLAMVMPLTDQFDPGVTHFAHEHLQVCHPRPSSIHPSGLARLFFSRQVLSGDTCLISTPAAELHTNITHGVTRQSFPLTLTPRPFAAEAGYATQCASVVACRHSHQSNNKQE